MNIKTIKTKSWMITLSLITALTGFASVAGATYTLPASRSVKWQGNVGVLNDIPNRTTISKTLSPSGGDDTSAIKTALSAAPAGSVVKLNAGTFKVSSTIDVPSNKTLRGAGMGSTIIQGQSTFSGDHVVGTSGISYNLSTATAFNVASAVKGSTTITTSSAHNWVVGSYILIDENNAGASADPPVTNVGAGGTCTWCGRNSGARVMGQIAKVVAVPSSTTATLEMPLYATYNSSRSAQAIEIKNMPQMAGIENLTVNNTLSNRGSAVWNMGGANCWVLNVEIIGTNVAAYRGYYTYRTTVRGCKVHEAVPATPINGSQYGPGRGYGIWLSLGCSAGLIENNNVYHVSVPLMADGAIGGCVWAYNVLHDIYYTNNSWNREAFGLHGGYTFMNLFEGNISTDWIIADNFWGNTGNNTFFRNRSHYALNKSIAQMDVIIGAKSWYWNFIGNVLGTPGEETTYQINGGSFNNTNGPKAVYHLGYNSGPNGGTWDQGVANTLLRHANWDSATNGVVWNGSDDRVLPASMYLTSKPGWWGSAAWPIIGPDVTPMYPNIESTWVAPWGTGTGKILPPPTKLTIQ